MRKVIISYAALERYVLHAYRLGSDTKNYKIICMLLTTVEEIMKELDLTKMPAGRRLNMLMDAGLISWQKGTSEISRGPLTKPFLKSTESVGKYIFKHCKDSLLEDLVRESMRSGKIR